jgi:hypothetical protein
MAHENGPLALSLAVPAEHARKAQEEKVLCGYFVMVCRWNSFGAQEPLPIGDPGTGRARKQHLEASWALTLGCLRLHLVGVRMFISPVQTSTDRKVPARGLQAAPAKQTRLWRS